MSLNIQLALDFQYQNKCFFWQFLSYTYLSIHLTTSNAPFLGLIGICSQHNSYNVTNIWSYTNHCIHKVAHNKRIGLLVHFLFFLFILWTLSFAKCEMSSKWNTHRFVFVQVEPYENLLNVEIPTTFFWNDL